MKIKEKKVNITLDQTPNSRLEPHELLFDKTFVISTNEQRKALDAKEWSSYEAMLKSQALNKAFENGLKTKGQTVIFKII